LANEESVNALSNRAFETIKKLGEVTKEKKSARKVTCRIPDYFFVRMI